MEFVATVAALAALGWWADSSFGWTPWATLTGMVVGFVSALVNLFRIVNRQSKK